MTYPPPQLQRRESKPSDAATPSYPIARQHSVYSLTLDEFKSALGESGGSFGSMNMEEFLRNVWTVEESQAMAAAMEGGDDAGGFLRRQQSLQRQASFSLARTLSKKTVDDIWKELDLGSTEQPLDCASGGQERQITFGEMTLEDFLIKAGVVKEVESGSHSLPPFVAGAGSGLGSVAGVKSAERLANGATFGVNFSSNFENEEKPRGIMMPTVSLSQANACSGQTGFEPMQIDPLKLASPALQPTEWLTNNEYKPNMNHPLQQHNVLQQHAVDVRISGHVNAAKAAVGPGFGTLGAGGLVGTELAGGLGAHGNHTPLGPNIGTPPSPVSDMVAPSHNAFSAFSPLPYGPDGTLQGRRRAPEGSLEKVVERRHKRMIKNRESAARSRARKQAYTVELEAEVTQLKEENMRLRMQEKLMAEQRKKQILDLMASFVQHRAPKIRKLRRTCTGPW